VKQLSATSRAQAWARQRWAGLALIGLVLAAAVTRILQTRGMAAPVVLCDEFIYANLAKNLADHGQYLFRDVTLHQSLLYPLLLAPAWLLRSMSTTYGLAKGINASAMALTAVPVYFWGRRLVQPLHALIVAALTLLLPAFFFSGILMTEAVFLPAFVLATFAVARMLERPTLVSQLACFAAIALAVGIRVQGIVLLLVVPTAVLVKVVLDLRAGVTRGELVAWLRRLWPTALLLGGGFLLYVLYKLVVSEASLGSGLGPYQALAEAHYPLVSTMRWTVKHLAELGLAVGLVPLSALIVLLWLALRGAPTTEAERAFLAVVPAALLWVLVEAGAFAATVTPAIFERYTFYLEPLLVLALVVWLARGLPRPLLGTAVALGVPALLLLSLRLAEVIQPGAVNGVTLGSLYRFSLHLPGGIHELKAAIAAAALLVAFLFAICARPVARIALPLLLGLYLAAAATSAVDDTRKTSKGGRQVAGGDPSWIVRAIGRDEPVVYVNTPDPGSGSTVLLLQTEFWNPNVSRVYSVGGTELCELPETPTAVDTATGRVAPSVPDGVHYAVIDRRVPLGGTLVAVGGSSEGPLALYRVDDSLLVGTSTEGVYSDGWMGSQAQYSVFVSPGRRPGRLVVTLGRAGWGGADVPGRVEISVGRPKASGSGLGKVFEVRRWVVHRLAERTFVFEVPPPPVRVVVRIAPTFSPAQFGLPDERQLGAQVSFRYEPKAKMVR
jgi:hypothetical protein